jgi:hypothetical protein
MRNWWSGPSKLHFAAVVAGLSAVGPACDSEPCFYTRNGEVVASESPFADGSTAFSKCSACPVLNEDQPPKRGPATGCYIAFGKSMGEGYVACLYGNSALSDQQAGISGAPNSFAYCEKHCPKEDATLGSCSLTADSGGVKKVVCNYGRACD